MHAFLALAVRCLIAIALMTNGGFASAHSSANASEQGIALAGDPPCHGDPPDPADSASHPDCCGETCVCGCVLAPMVATVMYPALTQPVPESLPARVVAAPGSGMARPPLRPPIA